jgi:NAD(P)-dependent dehydrogenase (short-subunit alcohol dehydrogenase family)
MLSATRRDRTGPHLAGTLRPRGPPCVLARQRAYSTAMEDVVLVTGAAGAIGSATAEALRAQGHRVVGLDIEDGVELRHDLLDTAGTERLLATHPALAGLRHVVAVAGGPVEAEIARLDPVEVPVAVFESSVRLNLVAQYALLRAGAARIEAESPDGDRSVTLFSSINALRGYGMPGYSAAKAGLLGLVVALALPLGRRGLRINAITPGTVLTERFREDYEAAGELSPRLVESTATGAETRPEDVAQAVCAVLGLRRMTGQHLVIDGGQMAVPFDHYPLA